jgi:hypothetical protein
MVNDVAILVCILSVVAVFGYIIYVYLKKQQDMKTKRQTEQPIVPISEPKPQAPKPAPVQAPKPAPVQAPKQAPVQAPKPAPVEAPKPAPVQTLAPESVPKPIEAPITMNPAPVEQPTTISLETKKQKPVKNAASGKEVKKTRKPTMPPPPVATGQPSVASPGFVLYEAGDPRLGPKGKRMPPVVTKAGKKAYQVEYKGGEIHPKGTNAGGSFTVPAFLPAEQLRVAFRLYYPKDFPWGTNMKKVGGKIFGFDIGDGEASGGNYSTTGASFRLTWNLNGGVGPYLYPELKRPYDAKKDGKPTWALLDQSKEVQKIGDIGGVAMHLWYPDKKDRDDPKAWTFKLKTEEWNDIEMFCKLNTPGKQDGILEVAINGVRKRVDSMRYRYDNAKINALMLSTFFGGGDKDYAPPKTTNAWYADFQLSKT